MWFDSRGVDSQGALAWYRIDVFGECFILLCSIYIVETSRTERVVDVRGVGSKPGIKGRIENTKRFTVPLLVRSLRGASVTVQSMESRGFGAYPKRSFVDKVPMKKEGKIITAICIIAVIIWYSLIFAGVIELNYSVQ